MEASPSENKLRTRRFNPRNAALFIEAMGDIRESMEIEVQSPAQETIRKGRPARFITLRYLEPANSSDVEAAFEKLKHDAPDDELIEWKETE